MSQTFVHHLSFAAEDQALQLLAESKGDGGSRFVDDFISTIPGVHIVRTMDADAAGALERRGSSWVIVVHAADVLGRQRFSAAHQLKHILDHHLADQLYPPAGGLTSAERAERVCDHFAACLLMPKDRVEELWRKDSNVSTVARTFGVSWAAMRFRLLGLGLLPTPPRCKSAPRRGSRVTAASRAPDERVPEQIRVNRRVNRIEPDEAGSRRMGSPIRGKNQE